MAQYYGISDLQEAREYMADEKLRSNLLEISKALQEPKKRAEEKSGSE